MCGTVAPDCSIRLTVIPADSDAAECAVTNRTSGPMQKHTPHATRKSPDTPSRHNRSPATRRSAHRRGTHRAPTNTRNWPVAACCSTNRMAVLTPMAGSLPVAKTGRTTNGEASPTWFPPSACPPSKCDVRSVRWVSSVYRGRSSEPRRRSPIQRRVSTACGV